MSKETLDTLGIEDLHIVKGVIKQFQENIITEIDLRDSYPRKSKQWISHNREYKANLTGLGMAKTRLEALGG